MTCKLEVEMDVAFHVSPGWRIICIGDQHGEIGLMRQLLELATGLKTTAPQTKIVYLGDLIDRGPDSLACLDLAISSQMFDGIDAVGNISGNHEELLYTAIFGETAEIRMPAQECWEMNGGSAVMRQLGKPKTIEGLKRALGNPRLTWLHSMTTWQRSGQFLFVHAGLNPMLGEIQIHQNVGIDLTDRFDEDFSTRWIREPFHRHQPGPSGWYGSFVVHGHDPEDGQMSYAQMRNRCRLNLDGGSYRTKQSRMATIEGNHIQVYSASL